MPDEYREYLSPLAWEQEARNREYRDEAFKEAVPEDKRELIRLLERWEAWELRDSASQEVEEVSDQSDSVEDTSERDRKTAEECIDSLDDSIQA